MYENILQVINNNINSLNIKQLNAIIQKINSYKKSNKELRLTITNQSKTSQINKIYDFLNGIDNNTDNTIIYELFDTVITDKANSLTNVKQELRLLKTNINKVEENINNIMQTLDKSIYAHTHAKNQIMKIIGQWMNGEQTGYCFGFEGSPGIGKTSMAKKGLSMCLKDDDGEPRPFSFIALGGSCNGSTLEGHSYTYLNSTWGKIVEILMESKCMNPIIYVDELDKVSKTENGREIIGIFTHLIDQTQNDCFQDKYFSGVNIDLSKALFIFSYNDPEQIDKILLDRIHRIKFENLTLDEKIVIVKRFILPEINKKMGFNDVVDMSDEMIEYIIDTYTMEPGVRKLKELLFDLYGEINLDILKNNDTETTLPIKITVDNLENKYLPKYEKVVEKYIHKNPVIGTINGLWANSLGRGGIIPIQTMLYPTSIFLDLRLTGLQGDVMKESMNVAKSLAWNLTSNTIKKKLITQFTDTKCQGLHIHCPEGAISKDGPSAGAAITTAIYSLFNNKKIDNTIAMTGEINLQGEVTKIGGLDMKISGGIKAGVKTFLYPKSNSREYNEWKKNANETLYEDIHFYEVSTIQEVFKIVFA
jgi:ATP-dependent Lon protease